MTPPTWRRYLTFWRSPVKRDVEDELHFHTTMRVKEYLARGMSEEDARRAVAERIGDVGAVTSECVALGHVRERNKRNAALFDAWRHDLRYAMRGLRTRPGFAAAVIVTLALGIGVNAAVFSVVDRLLFRTAPMLRGPRMISSRRRLGSADRAGACSRSAGGTEWMSLEDRIGSRADHPG